eukprot:scaffold57673_cov45-Cyclotella_meneghiniana.AAC.2
MEPEVPLFDALNGVMKDLRFLKVTCQKEVIAVFDGRAHPMKGSEESSREQNRKDSIAALNSIYNEDLPGLYDRVKKLRTAIVHRRVDFAMRIADECKKLGIKVIQAPFEADWQLVMQQEAMHRSFESGMNEKCLLSHYLFHTRAQRVVLTAQLKHAIEVNDTKDSLNWVPVRLEKLPPGYDGLGDRGFEGTSTSYPHCNPMKTPCFLEGRDQYTHAETVGTRDLCQGRYGSEAYNKRTNDHVYLQDKVPRCRFEFFENALKWSLFKANMCQPFLMPRNAGDYFPANTRHLQRPSKRARADLSILSQPVSQSITRSDDSRPLNYIDVAMPERYYEIGLDRVGLLMDGKDCTTDTIRVSSFISRAQYSDKMHCSAGRYIMWVLGGGLGVTCTPLFLGRVSEKALVEFWGGSTYEMLYD